MNRVTSVEDLEVFKRGHHLTLKIYKISSKFPSEEKFSLTPQMRKSASSIGANLLEGSHRLNRKEFRQFVGVARGSTGELKYHLLLAKDLGYIGGEQYQILRNETEVVSKMLTGLAKSLT